MDFSLANKVSPYKKTSVPSTPAVNNPPLPQTSSPGYDLDINPYTGVALSPTQKAALAQQMNQMGQNRFAQSYQQSLQKGQDIRANNAQLYAQKLINNPNEASVQQELDNSMNSYNKANNMMGGPSYNFTVNPNTGAPLTPIQKAGLVQQLGQAGNTNFNQSYQNSVQNGQQNRKDTAQLYAQKFVDNPNDPESKQALIDSINDYHANDTGRAAPTIATTEQPLITRGQTQAQVSGQPTDQEMAENIYLKTYKNQPLTDDEIRWQGRQQFAKPPQQSQIVPQQGGAMGYPAMPQQLGGMQQQAVIPQGMQPYQMPQPGQVMPSQGMGGYPMMPQQPGMPMNPQGGMINPMMQMLPQQALFTPEQYLNATPAQQQQMNLMAFNQQSQIQQQMLDKQFTNSQAALDKTITTEQQRYDQEQKRMQDQNQGQLDQFKQSQQGNIQDAITETNLQGQKQLNQIQDYRSKIGGGRTSKTMDLLNDATESTKRQVAGIERDSQKAVNEYQVSLLDKMNTNLDKLRQKMYDTQDERDMLDYHKADAQNKLVTDLFSASPLNPQNIIKTAQQLQQTRLEQHKMDLEEKKQVQESTMNVFKYMSDTFGSQWLQNMSPQELQNFAGPMGVSAQALASVGPTLKENEDIQKANMDNKTFEYNAHNDQLNRDQQERMAGINHQYAVDLEGQKATIALQSDDYKEAEKGKKLAALKVGGNGSNGAQNGQNAPQGSKLLPNGSGVAYQQPYPHPVTGAPAIATNDKIVNAYKPGEVKSPSTGGGMGGQCAYEARLIANCGPLGNSLGEKTAKLKEFVSKGQGFYPGQQQPMPGDVVIFNVGTATGHAAVVNSTLADNRIVLSEFNYPKSLGGGGNLAFSNSRTIDPTSKGVVGYIRAGVMDKYKMSDQDIQSQRGQSTGQPQDFNNTTGSPSGYQLGSIASKYESGGDPGRVSSGAGDAGGKSYGTFQFSSKRGSLQTFLNQSGYGDKFQGLAIGTAGFDKKWKELAQNDPEFAAAQTHQIIQSHVMPLVENLKNSGINIWDRGPAVKEILLSTGVQFGPGTSLIKNALAGKNVDQMSDADIINAISDYKVNNNSRLFASSSANVRNGVKKRHQNERNDLLNLIKQTS